ncbi:uncharacterized protein LOC101853448 isoform X2 [Aplysia californica]|uniref:Uncharacterized protein LOC101853448 isoform X2 n=1 Tax=Aplysia californica TaxID=6500 RepID=A0ABM0JHK9_APLCA|nr:uncharacterized protein LOC101853448 isoform X2 [Aplysia californica]
MSLTPKRFLRAAIIASAAMTLVILVWLHAMTDDVLESDLGSSPPPSLPPHHRHLSHYPDPRIPLPKRFRVVDIRPHGHRSERPNSGVLTNDQEDDFTCTTTKTTPAFMICLYKPLEDKYISASLLSSGVWEPYITKALQKALDRRPEATLIDVGANVGYYSLLAASMGHRVIAIEPQSKNVRRLVGGASSSHWGDNILVLANALSDTPLRNVSLSDNSENQGGIRVIDCGAARSPVPGGAMSEEDTPTRGQNCHIPTITLDDTARLVTTSTVILKLDIEGYECRALGVSSAFFSAFSVPYIFMEWRQMTERQHLAGTACSRERVHGLGTKLAAMGYVPHEVRSGIQLNPLRAGEWRVGDVYWREKSLDLLVPSL